MPTRKAQLETAISAFARRYVLDSEKVDCTVKSCV